MTLLSFTAGSLVVYGIQHFVSIIGSLVLIPLVIVPAMGGDDVSGCAESMKSIMCNWSAFKTIVLAVSVLLQKDTAYVVSTVLFVSGISTLLHSSFGSRLPLIQGASFVYLAPALAIINSSDFASIGNNVRPNTHYIPRFCWFHLKLSLVSIGAFIYFPLCFIEI